MDGRDMVIRLVQYPQIPKELSFSDVVQEDYGGDYRRALIEHPRLRFDGVYIAVCHCESYLGGPQHLQILTPLCFLVQMCS